MTNSGKLFSDELTQWLLEAGLFNINVRCLSIIIMNHTGKQLFYLMLMIVSICIVMKLLENFCGYFREDIPCELLGICTLVHVNRNFQMNDHSISVDYARYDNSIVAKYLF